MTCHCAACVLHGCLPGRIGPTAVSLRSGLRDFSAINRLNELVDILNAMILDFNGENSRVQDVVEISSFKGGVMESLSSRSFS